MVLLLGGMFIVLMTDSIQSISADHTEPGIGIFQDEWLVTLIETQNTNYLVCGNNPGSKYEKAIQLNIKILDETSFLKILKKEGVTL